MARREPSAPPKALGCFIFVFSLPFVTIGLVAIIDGVRGLFDLPPIMEGDMPAGWGIFVFGAMFAGIGGIFTLLGISIMRGSKMPMRPRKTGGGPRLALSWADHRHFPTGPSRVSRTSTGVKLQPDVSPFHKLIGITIFAVFWNGISGFILYQLITDGMERGRYEWFPIAFVGFFVLIGLAIACIIPYQIARILMVGDTYIELAREPLAPGGRAAWHLVQKGSFPITSLTVKLVCRESATYSVGTSTHTATHEVREEVLAELSDLQATGDTTPIARGELEIPRDAMHSFEASHNKILWGIQVKMELPGRPDVDDFFPFRVAPDMEAFR